METSNEPVVLFESEDEHRNFVLSGMVTKALTMKYFRISHR